MSIQVQEQSSKKALPSGRLDAYDPQGQTVEAGNVVRLGNAEVTTASIEGRTESRRRNMRYGSMPEFLRPPTIDRVARLSKSLIFLKALKITRTLEH